MTESKAPSGSFRASDARSVAVALCVAMLGCIGFLTRYAPGAAGLSQVAVVILILLGIASLRKTRLPTVARYAAVGFLLVSTVAAAFSVFRGVEYAFRGWIGLVTAVFGALAAVGAVEADRRRGSGMRATRIVASGVAFAVVGNVLLALRQAFTGMNSVEIAQAQAGVSTFESGSWIRLMGAFSTNQDFGLFVGCIAPAVLTLALRARGPSRKWLFLGATVMYVAVVLSLTRTALIGSVAAAIFALLFLSRGGATTRLLRTIFSSIVLVATLVAILPLIADDRVQDSVARAGTLLNLSSDTSYNARREATLPRALEAFWSNPLGSGAGAAGPVSQSLPADAPYGAMTTDNGYLMMAIQIGLYGALVFVMMLLLVLWHLARSESLLSKVGAASIVALVVAMLTAQYWALLAPMSVIAAIVGLAVAHADLPAAKMPRGSAPTSFLNDRVRFARPLS